MWIMPKGMISRYLPRKVVHAEVSSQYCQLLSEASQYRAATGG